MTKGRLIVGFLWLAVISTANAISLNESQLEEMYDIATELYRGAEHHWDMGSGYRDMLGEAGMKICFVDGPELEALVLGGDRESSNASSSVSLELQHDQGDVSIFTPNTAGFTVALWYSFRPVNFFAVINDTMACDLLQIGDGASKVAITYAGPEEYNLKYQYQQYVIDDNQNRSDWEFDVNDTSTGDVTKRGWQWNHIAMVFKGDMLTAYYNGFPINVSQTPSSSASIIDRSAKLTLNVPQNERSPCAPVGYDEVTLWHKALSDEDILALRVHVGRNRSLDEPEPTTTGSPDTTPGGTTAGYTTAGYTTAGNTTSGYTTVGVSTAGPEDSSAVEPTNLSVTAHPATEQSTKEQSTVGLSTDDEVTSTAGESTHRPVKSSSTSTTAKMPVATTKSSAHMKIDELDELAENVTNTTDPLEIAGILRTVEEIVADANAQESAAIAENVIAVLEVASKVKPADINSSAETLTKLKDYRKAFVNLFSSVLVQCDVTEKPESFDGPKLVEVMDNFLINYVDDPTVANDDFILSDAVDVQLAPVDGSDVQMDGNTSINIPVDAFVEEVFKVLICVLKRGLQNVLEPKGDEQPIDIGREYSKKPTWNITGPIIVMRAAGYTGTLNLKKNISFNMHVDPMLGDNPVCVYQDQQAWSGKGVSLVKYHKDCPCVTCQTDHMTNFAVLMAVDGVELTGAHAVALSIISYIGCSLSLFCLIIALILFIILRELNSTRMGIVKNLCVALFLAQLLFVAGIQTATAHPIACKAVAAMLHYFFLCVIAWMLCNGIYLYQKVKTATRPGSVVDLIYFCILGWGAPALVVAITAGINHEVYGTEDLCWLSVEGLGIWAFVIPAMIIIVFNAFVTFLTMKAFVSVKVFKDKTDKDKFKSGLRAIVVMLPILGLSWIFGLLAFGETGIFFQYLFALFNSLQGVFLFIFHIFLNDEVKGAMRRRFGKVGASGDENTLFNKIWAFSASSSEKTEMSSVTQSEQKTTKLVYKN